MPKTLRARIVLAAFVLVGVTVLAHTVRSQSQPRARLPLQSVAIEDIRVSPGAAELLLSHTPDAPQIVLRVDPQGGGDVTTIAEALQRVKTGEIALAAGEYVIDPMVLPPGVSLAGGFDPQTWRYDPAQHRSILSPNDPASDLPLLRLNAGSRVSGLVVRDARFGIDLAGDGVVLEGVGISHCVRGVFARREARGVITYATFVHNEAAFFLEEGTEVAVQNSIFQQNTLGITQLGVIGALPAPAVVNTQELRDPWVFPLASTHNLFFENGTDTQDVNVQNSFLGDPGITRPETVYPNDDNAERNGTKLPDSDQEDAKPTRLASVPIVRTDMVSFDAVRLTSTLADGERVRILDRDAANRPVLVIDGAFDGWKPIPRTTGIVVQIETNGDALFTGSVTVDAVGDRADENLVLAPGRARTRAATSGSTDGGPLGMSGAFDARATWLAPVVATPVAQPVRPEEQAEVQFLEEQLATLARDEATGDPVMRADGDAWEFLVGNLEALEHDGPAHELPTPEELIEELATKADGRIRSLIIDPETLAAATANFRTLPQLTSSFRLNGGMSVDVGDPSIRGLLTAVHGALELDDPKKILTSEEYLFATLGRDAVPDQRALERVASLYGAAVSESVTTDPRREVPVGTWLNALLEERRTGERPDVPAYDVDRCLTFAACPELAPVHLMKRAQFPEDTDLVTVSASSAEASGPWADVRADEAPFNFPLDGRLTSRVALNTLGLAANAGQASLTYRVVAPRTATSTLTLRRLRDPGVEPFTITVRGSTGTVELKRDGRGARAAINDDLGSYAFAAGDVIEVRVTGPSLLLGDLTLRAGTTLSSSFTSALIDAKGLTQTGGTFSAAGWTADGALAALRLEQPLDPSGARLSVWIDPGERCRADCAGPVRLLTLRAGARVDVALDGQDLLLRGGETTLRIPAPPHGGFPLALQLRRRTDGVSVLLTAGETRVGMILPSSPETTAFVELGSLDPAAPTQTGVTYGDLRLIPGSMLGASPIRSARLASARNDAQSYVAYVSTDPVLVRTKRAPTTVVPLASLRPGARQTVALKGLTNGVVLSVAVAVSGPGGETSALSDVRTINPSVLDPSAPPAAIPAFGVASGEYAGIEQSAPGGLPASRVTPALGDTLILDPSASVSPGSARLVRWSLGRDANDAPDPRTSRVFSDPGTYIPTLRFLEVDGTVRALRAPAVVVTTRTGDPSLRLSVEPAERVAPGTAVAIRGVFTSDEGAVPAGWRVRLDYGDGSPVVESGDALRVALLENGRALQHTYAKEGSYTLAVTMDDDEGTRRVTARRTVLVGAFDTLPPEMTVEIAPQALTAGGTARFILRIPASDASFLGWNFGDARSADERAEFPAADALGTYGAARSVSTPPLQTLGNLPVFLRVRDADGTVALSQSAVYVRSPGASLDLERSLLFGSAPAGLEGRSLVLFRIGSNGERSYLSDVRVDANGFVLLPLATAGAEDPVGVIRGPDDTEYIIVDGENQVRTSAGTARVSLHGFTAVVPTPDGEARLDANFPPSSSVTTDVPHGVRVIELPDGVTLGTDAGLPALMEGGRLLLAFDFAKSPRLAKGLTLRVEARTDFSPLTLSLLEGERKLATLHLYPEGAIGTKDSESGYVLSVTGTLTATVSTSTQTTLRPGDELAIAARDARGVLSRELTRLTVGEEDVVRGRAPAFGLVTPGSQELVPLSAGGATMHANSDAPTFFGIAPPGSTVEIVTRSAEQRYTVTADERGTWRLTPRAPLEEGAHEVDVRVGDTLTQIPLMIDLTPPEAPRVTGASGRALTGMAEPGSTVAYHDPRNDELGAVMAGPDGRFRMTLPDRITTVALKSVDAAGNISETTRFELRSSRASSATRFPLRTVLAVILAILGAVGLAGVLRASRRHPL